MQTYQKQLEEKTQRLQALFSPYTQESLEVFESPPEHYRMRAEFRVWHEGEDLYFYMFDKESNLKIRLEQYPVASLLINQVMKDLLSEIKTNQSLRHKLFQVDFLSTLSGEILVTMLYHKQLDDTWKSEALKLKNKFQEKYKINLVGRARKQKIDLDLDFVIEELSIHKRKYRYKQIENSFTQPNAIIATKMLEWAIDVSQDSVGDLLELYCGNGNFSIALAQNFTKVLATEVSSSSVEAAQYNIEVNGISNLQIIRMSSEDFSDALSGTREYYRLKGIDLKSYNCKTIFVDPPRSGLDEKSLLFASQYEKIIYISCNPETLSDNLSFLTKTHNVTRVALFDQFPFTHHIESGVVLERKLK